MRACRHLPSLSLCNRGARALRPLAVEWDILLDQLVSHAEQQHQARDEGLDPALQLAEEALDDVRQFLEQHARLIVVLSDPETRRKLLWLRVRKMMVGSVRGRGTAWGTCATLTPARGWPGRSTSKRRW